MYQQRLLSHADPQVTPGCYLIHISHGTMASLYSSFLQSPNPSHLAADAQLFYITTTTEVKEAASILKHLQSQLKQVEKKEEKVLNVIESQDGLAVETETSLLFKTGGGAYLPGMDANLLDEQTVTLPMTHIVRFDADHKIKQIRVYWDQGTMLKQVEAIGKTGRNWPIKDGKAQLEAVSKSIKAAGQTPGVTNGTRSTGARGQQDVVINQHKKSGSVTRDPHASLSLFAPRDPNEEAASRSYTGPGVAPRVSAKPAARDFVDIAGNEPPAPHGTSVRSPSPSKAEGAILKSGAGKHFLSNRLFDQNDPAATRGSRSPERKKTYEGKYEHFQFGHGEEAPAPPQERPMSKGSEKNQAHFSFEDFATPPKHTEKPRPDYERHWGAGVQDVSFSTSIIMYHASLMPSQDDPPSIAKRPVVHAARPDARSHFALADDSPVATQNKPKSLQRQKGMGLYQDPIHADERASIKRTNVNNTRRGEETDHFSMADSSPSAAQDPARGKHATQSKTTKARNDMDSNWSFESPVQEKKSKQTKAHPTFSAMMRRLTLFLMQSTKQPATAWAAELLLEGVGVSAMTLIPKLAMLMCVPLREVMADGTRPTVPGSLKRARSTKFVLGSAEQILSITDSVMGVDGSEHDKDNIEPQQKRRQLSGKVIGFRDAAGVLPDATLSEDDGEVWPTYRKSKVKGWL